MEKRKLRIPTLRRPTTKYQFADRSFETLGKVSISLATSNNSPLIIVEMDVVSADISALLDMNVLARELLIAETVNNRLVKRSYVSHEDGSGEYVDEWS